MNQFLDGRELGFGELFTEDGVFEGAFSGGVLQGRALIESHFRHNVRRLFLDGIVQVRGLEVAGRKVRLDWDLTRPGAERPVVLGAAPSWTWPRTVCCGRRRRSGTRRN